MSYEQIMKKHMEKEIRKAVEVYEKCVENYREGVKNKEILHSSEYFKLKSNKKDASEHLAKLLLGYDFGKDCIIIKGTLYARTPGSFHKLLVYRLDDITKIG